MKGIAVKTKDSCSENRLSKSPPLVKGPRPWTAAQIDRKATTETEVLRPKVPKRNAAHSRSGTRE
jgi:hypothetical protein